MTTAIESISAISEQNSAATQEVSASAEQMTAQVDEVVASAQTLSEMAEDQQRTTAAFKLKADENLGQDV